MSKGSNHPNFRRKPRILFAGIDNATHTQMAEAYMRQMADSIVEVKSAGIHAGILNPATIAVMQEDGIDIRYQNTKEIDDDLLAWTDLIVTLCHSDKKTDLEFPSSAHHKHWPVSPPESSDDKQATLEAFRKCRDEIKQRTQNMVNAMRLFNPEEHNGAEAQSSSWP